MTKVFVVESDPQLREWCRLHLATLGLDVAAFDDARRALDALRLEVPDLVIVATDLPGMGAFALAAALRSTARTALTPILFLVPGNDAQALSQAQAIEPHGVLSKPLSRAVLVESVSARVAAGGASGTWGSRASAQPASFADRGAASGAMLEAKPAAVLVVVLRNFASLARGMTAHNLDRLLEHFAGAARQAIFGHGGWIVRGDAMTLVALFESARNPDPDRAPACRALEAALAAVVAARRAKKWADGAQPKIPAPDLSVGCGVHTGEVLVARLSAGGPFMPNIAGQTVDLAYRLDGRAKGLHWSVAASQAALLEAGARVQAGRQATLTDSDHGVTIPISEVLGLNPGTAKPGELPYMGEVREAVVANTLLARLASDVDQSTADRTLMVTSRAPPEDVLPEIPERRLQRRLRNNSVIEVYTALHLPSDREELVKLLPIGPTAAAFVAGYLDEYRKLVGLEQRNVVAVHEVGQARHHAYVVMEYVGGDSLIAKLARQLPVGVALNCIAQAALALDAIHQLGIVHGALKPEHFLFREDGGLVLTDFNVIARVCASLGMTNPTDKAAWLVHRSSAALLDATPRIDFQALGRILHAMLTGENRLLEAEKNPPEGLLAASRLPLPLTPLQECLDALLGVGDVAPTQCGEDLLVLLFETRTVFPFDLRVGEPEANPAARKLG